MLPNKHFAKYVYPGLLALGLATGLAAHIKSSFAENVPFETTDMPIVTLTRAVDSLRFALVRGDMPAMQMAYQLISKELTKESNAALCDSSCSVEIARYHLFRAVDTPLLKLSNLPGASSSAASSLQEIQEGLEALENTAFAPVSADPKATVDEQPGSMSKDLQSYFLSQHAIAVMKIRLYLARGDIYYQNLSYAHADLAVFAIDKTVGGAALTPADFKQADLSYEEAEKTLIEARTVLPQLPDYAAMHDQLVTVQRDLDERTESLRSGKLFLGIDVDDFSVQKFDPVLQALKDSVRDIVAMDADIAGKIESWRQDKGNLKGTILEEKRFFRGEEINARALKIAKLEATAEKMSAGLKKLETPIENQIEDFEFRKWMNEYVYQNELSMRQTAFDVQSSFNRAQADLKLAEADSTAERRSELRWLIDWSIAKANLSFQQSGFEDQIKEYRRQEANNLREIADITDQLQQKDLSIDSNKVEADKIQSRIGHLEGLLRDKSLAVRDSYSSQICEIEHRLTQLGFPVSTPFDSGQGAAPCPTPQPALTGAAYIDAMCGVKGILTETGMTPVERESFVYQCIYGRSPPAGAPVAACDKALGDKFTNLEELKKLRFGDKGLLKYQATLVKNKIANIKDAKSKFDKTHWALNGAMIAGSGVLTAAEALYAFLRPAPETSITIGMASGMTTTWNPAGPAESALRLAENLFERSMKAGQIQEEWERVTTQLDNELNELYDQEKVTSAEEMVDKAQTQQMLLDLTGEASDKLQSLQMRLLEQKRINIDCTKDSNQLKRDVSEANAERRRMIADFSLARSDLSSINQDMSELRQDLTLNAQALDGIKLDKTMLERRSKYLTDDNQQLASLIGSQENKFTKIGELMTETEKLANQSVELTDLFQLTKQQATDLTQKLSDDEQVFLTGQQKWMTESAQDRIEGVTKILDKSKDRQEIQQKTQAIFEKLYQDVEGERHAMEKIANTFRADNTRDQVFIANQQEFDELLLGLPEMLEMKRRALLGVSQLIQNISQRSHTLNSLTSGASKEIPRPVDPWNTNSLVTYTRTLDRNALLNSKLIHVSTQEIELSESIVDDLKETSYASFTLAPPLLAGNDPYRLWLPTEGARSQLRVVDLFLSTPDVDCTKNPTDAVGATIKHMGDGVLWQSDGTSTTGIPKLEFHKPRSASPNVTQNSTSGRKEELKSTYNGLTALTIPQFEAKTQLMSMPFLGLPLQAHYRINYPLAKECAGILRTVKLVVAYSYSDGGA